MSRAFQIKNLPLEILEHIWSYLDFHNCQKICTLVSMVWFWGIRNSSKLSTEMKIKRGLSNEEVNFALDSWPKLQLLQVDDIFSKVISDIQKIKNYEDLEKLICRPNSSTFQQLGNCFNVQKIWINPKKVSSDEAPFKSDHIISITVSVFHFDTSWYDKMKEIIPMMTSLEELEFLASGPSTLDFEWMASLKRLKNLKFGGFRVSNATSQFEHLKKMTGLRKLMIQNIYVYFSSLLNILNSLGEMKNLQVINIQILLENDWDEQMVKEKFKKAEETIDQKFHGVSRRLYIVERNYGFTIQKNC